MEADPRTLPSWVHLWDDPTENFGLAGGTLRPPHYKRDLEVYNLELSLMLTELEHHANWGI